MLSIRMVCGGVIALTIDAISLGLLIVALLPWASSLIESAKFPGGWEIKFRDLKKASRTRSEIRAGRLVQKGRRRGS